MHLVPAVRDDISTLPMRRLERIEVPPRLFGHYAVDRVLGSGGMSDVYLARDRTLGRQVALKVLRRSLAADADHVERFRREAMLLSTFDSPRIVSVYDLVVEPDATYFAMRFIRGRSVGDELLAEGSIHPPRAAALMVKLLGAVGELHDHGVLHRDLKPENVLVNDRDDVVLIDLGVALDLLATPAKRGRLTRPGYLAGTVAIMAPEQLSGGRVDERADLYQCGLLLGQMLTGLACPDEALVEPVHAGLAEVVGSAMAPLGARYRSAAEMSDALVALHL